MGTRARQLATRALAGHLGGFAGGLDAFGRALLERTFFGWLLYLALASEAEKKKTRLQKESVELTASVETDQKRLEDHRAQRKQQFADVERLNDELRREEARRDAIGAAAQNRQHQSESVSALLYGHSTAQEQQLREELAASRRH